MRAIACVLVGALTLATAGVAAADHMQGMSMPSASAAKHGQGAGVITAIDPAASTLTIQYGAILGVGWPAMTMTLARPPR
jgi:Cu/Ag efflux protein CusF